uniref:Uncharacterized protein n=1 Tax=Rhizophora mucronata TaxID=61149 RepID=A0A2P2Q8Z5_RHIMU
MKLATKANHNYILSDAKIASRFMIILMIFFKVIMALFASSSVTVLVLPDNQLEVLRVLINIMGD